MTTTTPPDNLRICINELYKIVAELPAGDNAARLNSVIAALQAKTDEQMELVEALRNVLIEADCHADKSGIVMWQDRVYGMCAKARAILAKIGAS